MVFLIALILAAAFLWGCAKPLKKHSVLFYLGAVVIALAVIGCTWGRVSFPAWCQTWVWPLVSRGALATALFAAVMWTGALPNGSKAIRHLMPIRGELSILACILTLGHNIAYGQTYFRFLFTRPDRLPPNQLAAAVCSLVMIAIMLPLFVTSFPSVRRKMNARSWKRLQRFAYGFYALAYLHVMLLSVPNALAGRSGYALNVLVYSVVFLGYAVCRVLKAQAVKARTADKLPRRQMAGLAGALAVSLCLTGALGVSAATQAAQEQAAMEQTPVEQESQQPETEPSPEAETPDPAVSAGDAGENDAAASGTEEAPIPPEEPLPEEPQPSDAAPEQTQVPEVPAVSEAPQPEQTPPSTPEPTAQPTPESTPTPTPTPEPTPARKYKNGTFSGSGEGYWSTITVNVTIQDDVITAITVVSADEDEPYYTDALAVINTILARQSANVDTVSGATYSSGGIIDAVAAALASAKN